MPSPSPNASVSQPIEMERRLVQQVVEGDRTAARRFIGRYQRPVVAIVRRMLAPAGLDAHVEDLAQETFVRAIGALPRFDLQGTAKVSTWILTIATRLALQTLQKKRLTTVDLADHDEEIAAPERADAGAERAALGRAIARAVGELPPPHRAAFLLREYHGLSYDEIAETLRIDLGTVKSRLSRAKSSLRRALTDLRVTSEDAR